MFRAINTSKREKLVRCLPENNLELFEINHSTIFELNDSVSPNSTRLCYGIQSVHAKVKI